MSVLRTLAALLTAGLLLTACGAGPDADSTLETSPADPVLRDGDRVTATGRVVQVPGSRVRFCATEAFDAVGYAPGTEPPPRMCEQGVWVEGADLATLQDRREKAGAVEGWATLTGVLEGDTVRVEEQAAPDRSRPAEVGQHVPCPAPAGGWPRDPAILRGPGYQPEGDANMDAERPALERYRAEHPGAVLDVALLRPVPRRRPAGGGRAGRAGEGGGRGGAATGVRHPAVRRRRPLHHRPSSRRPTTTCRCSPPAAASRA